MRKYYTDKERLEFVKEWKVSKLNQTEFARKKGLAVATFRDWVHAYKNLQGQFIRINPNNEIEGNIIDEPELRMNMLSEEDKIREKNLNPLDIVEYRKANSIPIINKLKDFIESTVLKKRKRIRRCN